MKSKDILYYVLLLVLVLGLVFQFWRNSATKERAYRAETRRFKMVLEHQKLQLEIMKVNAEIERLKKEAEKKMPTYELTPREPEGDAK